MGDPCLFVVCVECCLCCVVLCCVAAPMCLSENGERIDVASHGANPPLRAGAVVAALVYLRTSAASAVSGHGIPLRDSNNANGRFALPRSTLEYLSE